MTSNRRLRTASSGRLPRPGVQVVVVDDNPMTVKLLEYLLREGGWKFSGFTSPHEALRALPGLTPDLIVTDYRMPRMSGPEFLLEAEKIHEGVPKMIMTAYGEEIFVQEMLRKAGVPSVSKANGLLEVIALAEQLASVTQALRLRDRAAC
ncbi:MAG: response regulator [Planctomycetota bacterium]|nr:response regulator [Planctomycetota bacterium]